MKELCSSRIASKELRRTNHNWSLTTESYLPCYISQASGPAVQHMEERTPVSHPPPLLASGERVDHFEIIRLLGSGGMGEVYLARDTLLSRKVALKLVRTKSFDDQKSLERFIYEIKVTARFSHPNIVTAYSVGEHDGHPYVALEYLEGDTLRQRMDAGTIPVRECIEISLAIARALSEAHRHHILHRDLKPENVALPRDGRVRVLDFGLARAMPRRDTPEGESGTLDASISAFSLLESLGDLEGEGFTGTPYYMAPEAWQSEPATERSDVWGLGVILYEMLLGERPFTGPSIFILGAKIVSNDDSPKLPKTAETPQELIDLVGRCLDKDESRRPSANETVEALEALLSNGGKPARPRRKMWLSAAAVVLMALVGILVLFGWERIRQRGLPDGGTDNQHQQGSMYDDRFPLRMKSGRSALKIGTSDLHQIFRSDLAPALFWGILHHEPNGKLVPVLVDELPTPENGGARPAAAGGFEVTWKLRPHLRWSDGHPLHAEDLVFGLEVFPRTHLVKATAVDSRTLVVLWEDQVSEALESIRPLPRHVLTEIYAQGGAKAINEHLKVIPTPVIGPYRVTDFRPDERLVLDVNTNFVGPSPSIPRVVVTRAEPEELITLFESKQIDLILPDHISLQQAEKLRAKFPEAVHIRPAAAMFVLQPDLEHRLLKRREVRQGLLLAFDRSRLVSEVFGSEGRIAHIPQRPPHPAGVEYYQHSPRQAAERLTNGGAVGSQLTLFHAPNGTERRIARRLAADLEEVGVHLEPRVTNRRATGHLFQGCRHGGLLLYRLDVTRRMNSLPFLNLPSTPQGYDLSVRHDGFDDQMATLVEREGRSLYAMRRSELRDSLWVAYSQRLPLLPLVFSAERLVVHPNLRGWEVRPGDRFGRGLEGWYFLAESTEGQPDAMQLDQPQD